MQSRAISRILSTLVVVVLGAAAAFAAAPTPNLSLPDTSGSRHSLDEYRGKIIVLNFWATWCPPCREEMPMLNKLAQAYAGKNVVFVAASIDAPETRSKIPQFLEKKHISLPVWTGASPNTLKQFDLGGIVPATIILDQNGEAVARIMGEARKKDITSRLDWLMADRQGKSPKAVLKRY